MVFHVIWVGPAKSELRDIREFIAADNPASSAPGRCARTATTASKAESAASNYFFANVASAQAAAPSAEASSPNFVATIS